MIVGGEPVRGVTHPEIGHAPVRRHADDDFPGICPVHGDCLEGLASGPAIAARWGQSAESLPPEHKAWALEAHYLALALHNYVCTLSPQRIVIGGGVAQAPGLLALVRRELRELLNGYVQARQVLEDVDGYVVPPGLGARSGVLGALALAERAVAAG